MLCVAWMLWAVICLGGVLATTVCVRRGKMIWLLRCQAGVCLRVVTYAGLFMSSLPLLRDSALLVGIRDRALQMFLRGRQPPRVSAHDGHQPLLAVY